MNDNSIFERMNASGSNRPDNSLLIRRRKSYKDDLNRLISSQEEIRSLFKDSDKPQVDKIINDSINYLRWRSRFGHDILKLLRIKDPRQNFKLLSLLAGVDLDKKMEETGDIWELDGIKIPYMPYAEAFRAELADNTFPVFLRRNIPQFDEKYALISHCYDIFDQSEGPYELGQVCVEQGDVVFDCGANIGMFSAVVSRYGADKVYAFEAIPMVVENYLSKTAGWYDAIEIVQSAVWDKEETLTFSMYEGSIMSSQVNSIHNTTALPRIMQVPVQAITLDDFVERRGINRVDFIKADIEGAERNMLRGATRILKEFAPKLAICTYHLPDDPQVLREIILKANPQYQIVDKYQKMYAHVPK